jgi:hypothetical protein
MGRALRMFPGVCAPTGAASLMASLLLMAPFASGQVAAATPPQTVVGVLHQLSGKADVIFAGQVVAIRHPNEGVVEVEFRVDQAIRGCGVGPYILREWAGLWAGGAQRYRVGQSLLMLLHAPGAAGMSSPVDGLDGAIPIRQGGAATPLASAVAPAQPPFVDLRWLGVKLPHAVSYSSETTHAARVNGVAVPLFAQQQMAQAAAASLVSGAAPVTLMVGSSSRGGASAPAQQASVDAVIGMLTTWQKAQHAAP